MAREAVIDTRFGYNGDCDAIEMTCASGTAIAKGCFLKVADPMTASASTGTGDYFAGIAGMDKASDDFATKIVVLTNAIILCTASGSITTGGRLKTAAPGNYVMQVTSADSAVDSYSTIVGVALDSASTNETLRVRMLSLK